MKKLTPSNYNFDFACLNQGKLARPAGAVAARGRYGRGHAEPGPGDPALGLLACHRLGGSN